jgi:IS30 family transposase
MFFDGFVLEKVRVRDGELRLNQRPRKTLGFETPADRLRAALR